MGNMFGNPLSVLLKENMKDWTDPRLPERKTSRIEIAIISALVIIPPLVFVWGLVEPILSNWHN